MMHFMTTYTALSPADVNALIIFCVIPAAAGVAVLVTDLLTRSK